MSFLMGCGVCCACISIWAILQLSLMGVFYKMETPILLEDVESEAEEFEEFLKETSHNYRQAATNCWIAAAAYVVMLVLSCMCLKKAKEDQRALMKMKEDDEFVCQPKMPKAPELVDPGEVKITKKTKKSQENVKAKAKGSTDSVVAKSIAKHTGMKK